MVHVIRVMMDNGDGISRSHQDNRPMQLLLGVRVRMLAHTHLDANYILIDNIISQAFEWQVRWEKNGESICDRAMKQPNQMFIQQGTSERIRLSLIFDFQKHDAHTWNWQIISWGKKSFPEIKKKIIQEQNNPLSWSENTCFCLTKNQ